MGSRSSRKARSRAVDDLGAQLFLRAQRQGHSHLLQVGMFFQGAFGASLICSANRLSAQHRAVLGGSLRLVENLDGDRITAIDQRRKPTSVCPPFLISMSSGSSPNVQVV